MPNPVVHFEIQSSNDKELQKYYADLFDWHVNADNPMGYGVVDTHTEGGIGGGIGGKQGGPNQVLWYVQVDDPDAYLKKAESLGGKTVMPVTEIPGMATFALGHVPSSGVRVRHPVDRGLCHCLR